MIDRGHDEFDASLSNWRQLLVRLFHVPTALHDSFDQQTKYSHSHTVQATVRTTVGQTLLVSSSEPVLSVPLFMVCAPKVISPTGNFDIFAKLFLKYNAESPLHQLKQADTVKAFNGEEINSTKKTMDEVFAEEREEMGEVTA